MADAANSFSGGIAVGDEATLLIAASGAQGTAPITFATTSGDTLENAGTLALEAGVAVGNALVINSGIATVAIPFGSSDTLGNSVSGAGTLALAGETFVLSNPSLETQSGGIVLKSGTLDLTTGPGALAGKLSFRTGAGADLIYAGPIVSGTTISGFQDDTIDLANVVATSGTIVNGNTLQLYDGTTQVGQFVLNGATSNLQFTPDGQVGTDITNGSALSTDWATPVSGTFTTGSNWSGGVAPGSSSTAFFSLNSPTPYTVSGGGTTGAIDVQFDQVTLSGQYVLNGNTQLPLQVGSNGSLTIAAGASVTGPSVSSQIATVGTGTGGGTLNVLGSLSVGRLLAYQGGTVIVDGSAANVTAATAFGAGYNTANELAPADLVIENGATVTDASGGLGFTVAASALVTGAGSTWTSTGGGGLTLGNTSTLVKSTLTVENDGTVSSAAGGIALQDDATLAVSPTATIIGAIQAIGQGSGTPVLEAIADPGQTGQAVTVVSNAVAIDGAALVLAGSADATLNVTGQVTNEFGGLLLAVNHVILADAANTSTLSGNVNIGAYGLYPFAGDQGVLEEAATGALGTAEVFFNSGTMIFDSGVTPTNTFGGFAVGDTFDLRDITYATGASAMLNGSTLVVTSPGSSPVDITLSGEAAGTLFNANPDGLGGIDVEVACYCTGTLILTDRGEVPIEMLSVGHQVVTFTGLAPVTWIGTRRMQLAGHPQRTRVQPIRIRAGAFGPGLPRRDLLVSPEHCVFTGEALVPARSLIGCAGIEVDTVLDATTYYHVELPQHAVMLAEGLPCESWLDTGNRAMFENAPVAALGFVEAIADPALWASKACAPLLTSGPALDALRARLGAPPPAMVLTLGRRGRHRFLAPAGVEWVQLVSAIGYVRGDARPLGAAITAISLDGRPVGLADTRLGRGFHAVDGACRWTDGAGHVEIGASQSARELLVDVTALAQARSLAA